MRQITLSHFLIILIYSCANNTNQRQTTPVDSAINKSVSTTQKNIERWLVNIVEQYFAIDSINMEDITSPQYAEYKTDAMNVELGLEESLSQKELSKKWDAIFDPKTHPIHTGFIISGQDYGTIKIDSIRFINKIKENIYNYEVLIIDTDFNIYYKRIFSVSNENENYKIIDIQEFN